VARAKVVRDYRAAHHQDWCEVIALPSELRERLEVVVIVRSVGRLQGDVTVHKPALRGRGSEGIHLVILAAFGCTDARIFAQARRSLTPYEVVSVADALGIRR
jgi:hypothetical protein